MSIETEELLQTLMSRRLLSHQVFLALCAYILAPLVFYSRVDTYGLYIGLLGIAPAAFLLYKERKNSFVRFHAMQSLVFFGAVYLLTTVLDFIPVLGWIVGLILSPIYTTVSFVVWLLLLWKTYTGEEYKLPYFGALAQRQLEKLR